MIQIIKYLTPEEAQQIIAEKSLQGLTLIEVQNVTEGNFLGFTDNPFPAPTPIEERLINIESDIATIKSAISI